MARVFLVVMDSVGIGGAPDAGTYFNDGVPDTGSNTLLHIARACADGLANNSRQGPLKLPNLTKLGIGAVKNTLQIWMQHQKVLGAAHKKHPAAKIRHLATGNLPVFQLIGTGIIFQKLIHHFQMN